MSTLSTTPSASLHYAIRGGIEGRERLRILARTLQADTSALFDRLQLGAGLRCVDAGCGGGDVTFELARRVGPHGSVLGIDIDEVKLSLAREEAAALGLHNIAFRQLDIRTDAIDEQVDVVYARFLLTHLPDPQQAIAAFARWLRPGGLVMVEDINFSGAFTYPPSAAFERFRELYYAVVGRRGGDPDIGPKLPLLLIDGGFERVDLHITQPMSTHGDAKLINPLTMENIAPAVLADGLASEQELADVIDELYAFAANPRTIAGPVRCIQAWGWRAVEDTVVSNK